MPEQLKHSRSDFLSYVVPVHFYFIAALPLRQWLTIVNIDDNWLGMVIADGRLAGVIA